jgi:hypothetical protein
MGTKKITLSYVLILAIIFCTESSFLGLYGQVLVWEDSESLESLVFQDKNNAFEWCYPSNIAGSSFTREISVEGVNVFIVFVIRGFGLLSWGATVFVKVEDSWRLVANTNFQKTNNFPYDSNKVLPQMENQLIIRADNDQRKIIFEIDSGQISELSFDVLNY